MFPLSFTSPTEDGLSSELGGILTLPDSSDRSKDQCPNPRTYLSPFKRFGDKQRSKKIVRFSTEANKMKIFEVEKPLLSDSAKR